jgi:hypothetical protein
MSAYIRSAIAAPLFLSAFLGIAPAAQAADEPKGIVCPPNKPYCIQKPALTQEEIDVLEGKAPVRIDPAEEARKARARALAAYRDPVSINLCPPPYYIMTDWDGCRPRYWR